MLRRVRKVRGLVRDAHILQYLCKALRLLLVVSKQSVLTVNFHFTCGQHFRFFDLSA